VVPGEQREERLDRSRQHRREVMIFHVLVDETREPGELIDRGWTGEPDLHPLAGATPQPLDVAVSLTDLDRIV